MDKSYRFCFLFTALLVNMLWLSNADGQQVGANNKANTQVAYQEQHYSEHLERVRILVKSGVLGLARQILEKEGPAQIPTLEWLNWERQLWKIYQFEKLWQPLYERSRQIPPAFSGQYRYEALAQTIKALIKLGQTNKARQIIRQSLWQQSEIGSLIYKKIRQSLIESYLVDRMITEAMVAARLFQRDYLSQDHDWLMLNARIEMRAGNPDNVINLLAPLDSAQARLLLLYARLQNKSLNPEQIIKEAQTLKAVFKDPTFMQAVHAVIVSALQNTNQPLMLVKALEDYLSISTAHTWPEFPRYNLDNLLSAYQGVANTAGNRAGLLVGNDHDWLELADTLADKNPVEARSLYATLLRLSPTKDIQQQTKDSFVNVMVRSKRITLLSQLFGLGTPFGMLTLSGVTGLRLSNYALEVGNIQLAADASASFNDIPDTVATASWLMQSARIAIYAGRYQVGTKHLQSWLDNYKTLTHTQVDQVSQVVFDLQFAVQHKLALSLFNHILEKKLSAKRQREIVYWMAQSYFGLEQYYKAAEYFLRSAMLNDNNFDKWGESAQLRAAEALVKANLIDDARRLYEQLLVHTSDPVQQQILNVKLQQLWLK